MKRLWIIGFLLFPSSFGAENNPTQKILFVGNSFTFYFNMPLVVESMAKEKGIEIDIYQSTAGGASLKDHWDGNKNLSTVEKIKQGQFDTIILQDYSTNPLANTLESLKYFNKFISLAKSHNAKVIIYGTWTYEAMKPKKYKGLDPVELALMPLINNEVVLAPVGTAFRLFQSEFPESKIFTSDSKHPSPIGSYLAACVFLKALTGESPKGLYRRYDRKDEKGKKIFLGMIEASDALKCQSIAMKIEIKKALTN